MPTLSFGNGEGGPITHGEMEMLLGPLQSCLQRMEGMLQELSSASSPAGETGYSKYVASTGYASDVREAELQQLKLGVQDQEQVCKTPEGLTAAAEPTSLSSEPTQGETNDPIEEGSHKPALHHHASCFDTEEVAGQSPGGSVSVLKQMKIDAELRGAEFGQDMGDNEKWFIEAVEAGLRCWSSIQEPNRSGWMFRLASSRKFETTSMLVIMFNSVLVACVADWQMQHSGEEPPLVAVVLETSCLAFFLLELLLRIAVHRCFFFVNDDMHWNIFDFVLVSISLVNSVFDLIIGSESNNNVGFMRLLRLGKLARIFRSLRSFRFFKSLVLLLESLIKSFISLFWGFIMLSFILYLFALVFMQALLECLAPAQDLDDVLRGEIMDCFGSLAKTIISLYMACTGGDDWSKYYHIVTCAGSMYGWVFIFYTFVLYFALFNIVTGTLVDKAMTSNKPDRAALVLNQRKMFAEQKAQFLAIFKAMDPNNSGMITRSKFLRCMEKPAVLTYMASIDVAVDDVELFFDTVVQPRQNEDGDNEEAEVPIEKFVEGCMHMKGTATAIDMQRQLYETSLLHADMRRFRTAFRHDFQHIESLVAQSRHFLEQMNVAKGWHRPVDWKL